MRWWCLGKPFAVALDQLEARNGTKLRDVLSTRISATARMLSVLADAPVALRSKALCPGLCSICSATGAGPRLRWACILRLFLKRVVMVPFEMQPHALPVQYMSQEACWSAGMDEPCLPLIAMNSSGCEWVIHDALPHSVCLRIVFAVFLFDNSTAALLEQLLVDLWVPSADTTRRYWSAAAIAE